ncbi:MAG: hypothetical protein AB1813_00185 [Verrucomicrobiota bacterium]
MNNNLLLASAAVALILECSRQAHGAVFTVTSAADSGPGSLRQAIVSANQNPGADRIQFNLPGSGPYVIAPTSSLPNVTDEVTIDGTTQPGFAGRPVVQLDGAAAANTSSGLTLTGGNSVIRGLVIRRFTGFGIWLLSSGNMVQGVYVGTDETGTVARGNSSHGIVVGGANNLIGGTIASARNVISANGGYGINIAGPDVDGTMVQGNYIGVNANGTSPLGNGGHGISLYNAVRNVIIGGDSAGAGNVISGNAHSGIEISIGSAVSTANTVQGNRIGTDATGSFALGNSQYGIIVRGGTDNRIGGSTPGARNIISGNRLSGVSIDNSGAFGAGLSGANRIEGNYIGLNANGTAALANAQDGVLINASTNNLVGGLTPGAANTISGNAFSGIEIADATSTGNRVEGNFIGTNPAGSAALGNLQAGINISAAQNNSIGSTEPGARNVISGNGIVGIQLWNRASGNLIQGNFIGTDLTGTLDVGNAQPGINVYGASNNTIGGSTGAARNVISGNGLSGIILDGSGGPTSANVIQGNFIGTDATGTAALRNDENAIFITRASNNTVGGTDEGDGNLLSGNGLSGIEIWNFSSGNLIDGNVIGADLTGVSPLANTEHGVFIRESSNNRIGGVSAGSGNRIAFNRLDGVFVESGTGNAIRQNEIFANGELGIDLGTNGVTPNDSRDVDTGSNQLQNFPALASAKVDATATTIAGVLNGAPNTSFSVDLFSNALPDPSGAGEGQAWLGTTSITTGSDGTGAFTVTLARTPPTGHTVVSATATDASGNTSEFSTSIPLRTVGILEPGELLAGKPRSEWASEWWRWAFSLPTTRHPLFDMADSGAGQSGPVLFLGGAFTSLPQADGSFLSQVDRSCAVQPGVNLFFPVATVAWDNLGCPANSALSESELLDLARGVMAHAMDLSCKLNGIEVRNLTDYSVETKAFAYLLPAEPNLSDITQCQHFEGAVDPAVAVGVFIAVAPLPVGRHTIEFSHGYAFTQANDGFDYTYRSKVKYSILVAPQPKILYRRVGNSLVLSWESSGSILQQSDALGPNASWTDVPNGGTSPVTLTPDSTARFFRLRQ